MTESLLASLGQNIGFVDDLYADYLRDPSSVSDAWRDFFADYRPAPGTLRPETAPIAVPTPTPVASPAPVDARPAARAPAPTTPTPAPAPAAAVAETAAAAVPLKGIALKIAENMQASVSVPTATSIRSLPVRLLEENRRLLNLHQSATSGPKISFTHLIAWAIVRALEALPALLVTFSERDGTPHRQPQNGINLGLAIDLERKGERVLLVPNIKHAEKLDFPGFVAAYNDVVARARSNKLNPDEFMGTNVSLTNPGTIGTMMSVPRLMPGQAVIVGTGAIGYPPAYRGMSSDVIATLGISKVMTLTSTYDHRVIQGAQSGEFLAYVESLLLGEHAFYRPIFTQLGVPHEPATWSSDQTPAGIAGQSSDEAVFKQQAVTTLIRAHRVRGHLWADMNPLGYQPKPAPELELSTYNLTLWDLDRHFVVRNVGGQSGRMMLRDILDTLRGTYCRHIGVEFMHIPEQEPRDWLQIHMEGNTATTAVDRNLQERILDRLNVAEALETFLHRAYVGQKRFSLEGAETLIPMLSVLLDDAADAGVEEAVIGMAHRGRLNVLTSIVGKPYRDVFREFEGAVDPGSSHGSGDVKYHLGAKGEHHSPSGKSVRLNLACNPSHLEAVNPVVEGMARAIIEQTKDEVGEKVLPILIHGDAAFAGQGVVAETLGLSRLKGYATGGTVHIVVNNQIGFTADPEDLHSSIYCTDVAKSVRAPIFHVNGDYPEEAVRVIRLGLAFRQAFKSDVVIDLVCYRRWGHNEGDDPSYTQPRMYEKIQGHRSPRKLYTEQLLRRGVLDRDEAEKALEAFQQRLRQVHDEVKSAQAPSAVQVGPDDEHDLGKSRGEASHTSIAAGTIDTILTGLDRVPADFAVHPKLQKQLAGRRERVDTGHIDWALGETFAFGSLVLEGTPVRLSGEDSGRGTFSQRHSVLHDFRTGAAHVPLAHLDPAQAPFTVYDSMLSEFAVLGFEYGYSVQRPEALVLWEAQFGDFVNGAQVIIDQFIASAESKWNQHSSLVMLLPHGFEGQGPEHSSARIERFLQLCADANMRVSMPSSPAQYFHLLRRQIRAGKPQKPLVVFTPKSLLRLPAAVSRREDLTEGRFFELLEDPSITNPKGVRRVLVTSGKVYYDLLAARTEAARSDVAILRLEQYYPFPAAALTQALSRFPKDVPLVWVQEEPRNMGAWTFVRPFLRDAVDDEARLSDVCRHAGSSPATGSHKRHQAEQDEIVRRALG